MSDSTIRSGEEVTPAGLGALQASRLWLRINLAATLLAVFAVPVAALGAMSTGADLREAVQLALWFEAAVSTVFLVDLVSGYAARGSAYGRDPVHWINWLAILAVAAQLAFGMAGIANARILRILPAIRAVAHLGLLTRGRVDDSRLGAEAVQRMNEQDTWFTLALLLLLSVTGQLTFGEYASIQAALGEVGIYLGFIVLIRWKAAVNRRHVEEVFLERLRAANTQVLDRMQEIPGLEDGQTLIEDRARELDAQGKPQTEIEVMVSAIGMIIANLRRFISRRAFAEARGEEVLAPDRPVALMFTDVESFSRVTQAMRQDVIPVMKHYLGDMGDRVFHYEGDIDKFIGDAVFAYFDDPQAPENAANLAFDAALEMQAQCRWLATHSESWSALFAGDPAWDHFRLFKTRIGLHTGPVIAGPIGSDQRADSTLLGDDVNLAARLEALCKQYNAYYLLSEDFYQALSSDRQARCRWVDRVTVAGREESPLNLYTLDEEALPAAFHAAFDAGREAYLAGDWQGGHEHFNAAQAVLRDLGLPEDPVATSMLDRIDGNRQFWFRAVDHIHTRAPDLVDEEMTEALVTRREEMPYQAPVTWQGHWKHGK